MAISQHIVRDLGGTIDILLNARPAAAPAATVTVRGPGGTIYVNAQSATVDSVETTLSSSAARGARSVAVTSATGIIAGREYLVGDGTSNPREHVRVRSISGTTITLVRPLLYAQASGDSFDGVYLSYAVTAAQATSLFLGGRVTWIWTEGTTTRNTLRSLDCTLYPHERLATAQDLGRVMPKIFYRIPLEIDVEEALDLGYQDTLERLEGPVRIRTKTDSHSFIEATAYGAARRIAESMGSEQAEVRDYYAKRWAEKCDAAAQLGPFDNDQDGFVEAHEGGSHMIRVG